MLALCPVGLERLMFRYSFSLNSLFVYMRVWGLCFTYHTIFALLSPETDGDKESEDRLLVISFCQLQMGFYPFACIDKCFYPWCNLVCIHTVCRVVGILPRENGTF